MSVRYLLCILSFGVCALTRPADLPAAETTRKPNIVVIYADDLGYGDVQCYNPDRGKIPTPRIDRLASQGMRFMDAHSSSGVCSPSRYALLTGRYHWRTRLQGGIVNLWGAPLITPDRLTIASLAKGQGYRTACIGKWHLGWDWPLPVDKEALFGGRGGGLHLPKKARATDEHRATWRETFSQPIPGGPVAVGFDEYFGVDVPNWPPYCFIENDRTMGIPSEFAALELFHPKMASVQGPALKGWTLEPILPALAARAVAFIEREARTSEPFLLYLPLTSPHTPIAVNQEWQGRSGLTMYADFVMETDAVIGQVLDALEKQGVAEHTLVVFTSDNGFAHYVEGDKLEQLGHFPSGPLRGYKSDAWEGGHRVPFVVRWPGVVEPGAVRGRLVHQADLMATLAEILGVTLPDDSGEDSFSVLSLLKGGDDPVRKASVSCSLNGVPSLRLGHWKYIAGSGAGPLGKEKNKRSRVEVELYNLAEDIGETTNLAAAYPERVEKMQAVLEALIVKGRSTPGPEQKNDGEVWRFPLKPRRSLDYE